jgi:hypothetical protein
MDALFFPAEQRPQGPVQSKRHQKVGDSFPSSKEGTGQQKQGMPAQLLSL